MSRIIFDLGAFIDALVVFSLSQNVNSSSIMLSFYLPMGNLLPSERDKRLTMRFVEIGGSLNLFTLEHLILIP